MARSLAEGLRRATEGLELPPEVGRRVLAALAPERAAREEPARAGFWWRWLAWPSALAASAALLAAAWLLFVRPAVPGTDHPRAHLARIPVSVQLSFVTPTYTFRHEDGFVIDALTCETTVVNERLQLEMASLH